MSMKLNKFLPAILLFIFATIGNAQDENNTLGTLITDRPDATESPNTIPKGFIQVETGAFFESFEKDNIKMENFTLNTTLIRLGLLDNLELRLGWDLAEGKLKNNGNTTEKSKGLSPLLFGAKIGIAKEQNGWPEVGFLGHLMLPFSASEDYKPETTGVDFRFAFAHTLSENSSLSYNLGAAWEGDNPEAAYVYTIAYGQGFTDEFGFYIELYGDLPENSSANHLWDAGLTYLLSDSVQLDATVGTSLTEGQDLLLSGGISFRIPTKNNQQ